MRKRPECTTRPRPVSPAKPRYIKDPSVVMRWPTLACLRVCRHRPSWHLRYRGTDRQSQASRTRGLLESGLLENQKAFPRIAITRPAVPPQQALTTTSRINRNASLQPRRFGFPVEAAELGADLDMRRLAGRMVDWPTTLRWVPAIECEPAHMRPLCRLGRPQCGTVDKRRGHNPIRPITIR